MGWLFLSRGRRCFYRQTIRRAAGKARKAGAAPFFRGRSGRTGRGKHFGPGWPEAPGHREIQAGRGTGEVLFQTSPEGFPERNRGRKGRTDRRQSGCLPAEKTDAGKGVYREKETDSGKGAYREKETDSGKGTRREKETDSNTDAHREESRASKEKKSRQEKKLEQAQSRAEHSAIRLEKAKERLAAQKPYKPPGPAGRAATAAGASVWAYGHRKIHEAEHENVGTEAVHKTELLAEAGAYKAGRYVKRRIREHPARQAEKWERRAIKADAQLHYQKTASEHPELQSNALSRMAQKWKIKRQYAKEAREAARQGAKATGAAAGTVEKAAQKLAVFDRNHKGGTVAVLLLFCIFLIINSVFSALPSLGTGMMNAVVGTSYTAEDEDILGTNEDYTALENALRQEVADIERTHPGYDEYRYRVDELGHNPYELTSYLIAKLRTYTREDVQGELGALFEAQYRLTLTEEVETRYRTETRTGTSTSTDPETGETTTEEYEYEVEVAYEYYILHVRGKPDPPGNHRLPCGPGAEGAL